MPTPENFGPLEVVVDDNFLWAISHKICDRFDDIAFELGFNASEMEMFTSEEQDGTVRLTFKLLKHWRDRKVDDQGEVGQKLVAMLHKLDFKTVAEEVHNYLQELNQTLGNVVEATAQGEIPEQIQREEALQNRIRILPEAMRNMQVGPLPRDLEEQMEVSPLNPQGLPPREPAVPPSEPKEQLVEMDLPEYPMSRKPRGICVIINNRNFQKDPNNPDAREMPPRAGTEHDGENLKHIFTKLNFVVRVFNDLTHVEMMRVLIDTAHNIDHTDYDCFVCCVMTHGLVGHLFGVDGCLLPIKEMMSAFQATRCPSLAGKPKLFFLQACQGRDKMEGGRVPLVERDAPDPNVESDGDPNMVPNEADFLLGYATVPGFVSFRSRNHGSWYIRKLVEMLDMYGHKFDLLSILVKVNEEVSRADANIDGGIFKQIPAPLVTLRKKLYFR